MEVSLFFKMAKIEITILGTSSAIPTYQRAHPAIFLAYRDKEQFCCLFDCGEGTQRQMLLASLNPMKLKAIFIPSMIVVPLYLSE